MQQYRAVLKIDKKSSYLTNAVQVLDKITRMTQSPSLKISLPQVSTNPIAVQLDYVVLDNPRILSIAGYGYDVNSGYLTLSTSEYLEHMGIFNLDEYFSSVTNGMFDRSLFLYNLERFKLGEIDYPEMFVHNGVMNTFQTSTGSLCKQYLVKVNAQAFAKAQSASSGNNFFNKFNEDILRDLTPALRRITAMFSYVLELESDTGFLMSTIDSNISNKLDNLYNSTIDDTFLPCSQMDYLYKKELSAKSTVKYLNLRELLRISNKDADDAVFHSLMSTDDDIKKAVKSSPYKDIVKGAALSGVIKKKDKIIEGLNYSFVNPYLGAIANMITKYTSYVKTVFTKVKI